MLMGNMEPEKKQILHVQLMLNANLFKVPIVCIRTILDILSFVNTILLLCSPLLHVSTKKKISIVQVLINVFSLIAVAIKIIEEKIISNT